MMYLNQNFDRLHLGCFSINRGSEQNDKMSQRKEFGFKSMSEHVLNFVLVKKYLIYTLYEPRYLCLLNLIQLLYLLTNECIYKIDIMQINSKSNCIVFVCLS